MLFILVRSVKRMVDRFIWIYDNEYNNKNNKNIVKFILFSFY